MLNQILALLAVALLLGQWKKARATGVMLASVAAVFWLQPQTKPENFTFWLPFASLALSVAVWFWVTPPELRPQKENWLAGLALAGLLLWVDVDRFLGDFSIFPVFTPRWQVLSAAVGLLALLLALTAIRSGWRNVWQQAAFWGLLILFGAVKLPGWQNALVNGILPLSGTSAPEAPSMLGWLGFSYIAFRLLHTLKDAQNGRLPPARLDEFVAYVLFFPTLSAGPIERLERFLPQLRSPQPLREEDWIFALRRVLLGLAKKFGAANFLAAAALNENLASQTQSPGWMWVFVYAYALQIYLDFSGYTDVALGMARLLSIRLPENFSRPYLQPNLTLFWNNWHITLTQWFRAYYFNPLARTLRQWKIAPTLAVLLGQLSTMLLIGLWHGASGNYLLWGLWHGLGLFAHQRWAGRVKLPSTPLWRGAGIFFTFHFVAVGWVFFALGSPTAAWRVLRVLFGVPL